MDVICENNDVKIQQPQGKEIRIKVNTARAYYVKNYRRTGKVVHTVMDAGSNFNLSSCKEDFSIIEPYPTVRITAVNGGVNNGRPAGFIGKLHPINLGINYGVLFPALGEGQRIISGFSLIDGGWDIILNNTNTSRIESQCKTLPISWKKDDLPYIDMSFNSLPDYKHKHTINKVKKRVVVENLSPDKALALHTAAGHLYVPGIKAECQDCLATKGGRTGHSQMRDPGLIPAQPLQQQNLDF